MSLESWQSVMSDHFLLRKVNVAWPPPCPGTMSRRECEARSRTACSKVLAGPLTFFLRSPLAPRSHKACRRPLSFFLTSFVLCTSVVLGVLCKTHFMQR